MSEAIIPGSLTPSGLAQKELCNLLQTHFNTVHMCKQRDFNIHWLAVDQKLSLGKVTFIRTTFYEATTTPLNLGRIFFPLMGKPAAVLRCQLTCTYKKSLECVELFVYSTILYPTLQQREHFSFSIKACYTG